MEIKDYIKQVGERVTVEYEVAVIALLKKVTELEKEVKDLKAEIQSKGEMF